jgi:hypothetical protein
VIVYVYIIAIDITQKNKQTSDMQSNKHGYSNKQDIGVYSLWYLFDDAPKHNRLAFIRSILRYNGVDLVPDKYSKRYTVTRNSHNDMRNPQQLSIGSIVTIDDNSLNLISYMPPSSTNLHANDFTRVMNTFSEYTVTEINDGTTIGIYWYNNAWVIRTLNGFDVGEYQWNCVGTYSSILAEVMNEYKDFSFERLEKNKCYTIGIKHSSLHPFKEGRLDHIKRAWFIQSVDVQKVTNQRGSFDNAISKTDDIGIPIQTSISTISMVDIMTKKSNAYRNFNETGEVFYGVILASRYESIMIQSDLFDHIKNIFYISNFNKCINSGGYHRQNYLILNTCFNANNVNRDKFRCLFPQFDNIVLRFEKIMVELVEAMINRLEGKCIKHDAYKSQPLKIIFNNTVEFLLRHLCKRVCGTPKLDINITKTLMNFVRSSSHVDTMYDLMYYVDKTESCELQTNFANNALV